MATFEEWNQGLLDFYFNPRNKGTNIRFEVDKEFLDEEFYDLGGSAGFLKAVRIGPAHLKDFDYPNLASKFLGLVQPWGDARKKKIDRLSPPTFMPYLILFCYAWNIGDTKYSPQNYFERLNELYPNHGLKSLTKLHLYKKYGIFNRVSYWANSPQPDGMGGRNGFFFPKCLGNSGVGWPQGQVILSSSRKQRLGYLFQMIGINSGATEEISRQELIGRLRQNEHEANVAFGNKILELIYENNDEVINYILGKIKDWDGSIPVTGNNIKKRMANCRPLLLVKLNGIQKLTLTVEDGDEKYPNGEISFSINNYTYSCPISRNGPNRHNFKQQAEKTDLDFASSIFEGLNCEGSWKNGAEELPVRLAYRKKDFVILQVDNSQHLIETNKLPHIGSVYFILNCKNKEILEAWNILVTDARIRQNSLLQDYTYRFRQLSEVSNCQIWCITKIQEVPPDLLQPPIFIGQQQSDPIFVKLVGGYRIRSIQNKTTYFSWGPPQAHVCIVFNKQIIEAENATIAECKFLESVPSQGDLLKTETKIYSVIPNAGEKFISLKILEENGGKILQELPVFFNWKDDVKPLSEGSFIIGKLGESTIGEGLAGVRLSDVSDIGFCDVGQIERFTERISRCGSTSQQVQNYNLPGAFLTWLADRGGRVPYGVVRDFLASQIITCSFGNASPSPSSELKALRQLGHIEIETDNYGRFNYVRPLPPSIYALPTKSSDNLLRAALTGCYTKHQFNELKLNATRFGLSWDSIKQFGGGDYDKMHYFVPFLEMIKYNEDQLSLIEDLANLLNIKWIKNPPAFSICKWAGSLSDWENSLHWNEDATEVGDAKYDTTLFDFSQNVDEIWRADPQLRWFGSNSVGQISLLRWPDPQTNIHHRHQIKERKNGTTSYAFVRQREWGWWFSIISQNNQQGFAYFPNNGRVILPEGADLPHLLSRILTLCSGLAPSYIPAFDFSPDEKGFLDQVYSNYVKSFVQYADIPFDIAKSVFAKVDCAPNRFKE
jgi:hypothetical protein